MGKLLGVGSNCVTATSVSRLNTAFVCLKHHAALTGRATVLNVAALAECHQGLLVLP